MRQQREKESDAYHSGYNQAVEDVQAMLADAFEGGIQHASNNLYRVMRG